MEIYLVGGLIALVVSLTVMAISGEFQMNSENIMLLLVATALSWGAAICLTIFYIMFFASETLQFNLCVFLQNLYDRLNEICERQQLKNNQEQKNNKDLPKELMLFMAWTKWLLPGR